MIGVVHEESPNAPFKSNTGDSMKNYPNDSLT